MDGAGQQVFARARLTQQKHRESGLTSFFNQLSDVLHGGRLADQGWRNWLGLPVHFKRCSANFRQKSTKMFGMIAKPAKWADFRCFSLSCYDQVAMSEAKRAALPQEQREEFDRLLKSYVEEFRPEGVHETFLVELMVQARLKIARLGRIQGLLNQSSGAPNEAGQNDRAVARIERYTAAAERSYAKALKQLQTDQRQRRQSEAEKWKQLAAVELGDFASRQ